MTLWNVSFSQLLLFSISTTSKLPFWYRTSIIGSLSNLSSCLLLLWPVPVLVMSSVLPCILLSCSLLSFSFSILFLKFIMYDAASSRLSTCVNASYNKLINKILLLLVIHKSLEQSQQLTGMNI